ncbi:helix-turn-helix transcriptional regulator [Bacteroides clarus]|jgi:AraC-like DNA-binding protein|uniref:HTH araC/xylS-type domain-containing protein n=1 Tax=Bacteroides clarus TaxID=626929 RepID=A0A1Y3YV33_9BACE|nr:helix-turn-helix transcriptional regulator [Bacteroides clarus]OUO01724.1 hypothetical protein B5F97_05710 [Bacteroides clarus]
MTFITLLEAVIIIYLAVYNIRIIRKMDRLKKQLRSSSPDKPNLKETLDTPLPVIQETEPENKSAEPKADGETKVMDSTKDKKLFERINRTIIEEQLFLDPEFSREKFIRLGLINKNKVAQLLQQYANTNLNGYINSLRLEYASKLIQTQPDIPIKAVAIDSGFNSSRTFYRLFQQKYGMTPAEYKESLHGVS